MVRWYHLILSAYGFWLPNDPRGSWSEFVGSWELYRFGSATRTSEKRSLAHERHDVAQRLAAKKALKYPPVRFDEKQRQCIGRGFALAVEEGEYDILACCIAHDHAHLIVARHARPIEQIASHLKSKSTMALNRSGLHPLKHYRKPNGATPSPWSHGIWSVFIDDPEHQKTAVRYVRRHPLKEGLTEQQWGFVQQEARVSY